MTNRAGGASSDSTDSALVRASASNEYSPVSLAQWCNGGVAWLSIDHQPPLGEVMLRGLPFRIEGDPSRCFVVLGHGGHGEVDVAIGIAARWIVLCHALVDSTVNEGASPGRVVGELMLRYRDGEDAVRPLRERYEIARPYSWRPGDGTWGHPPALAWPDQKPGLPPRYTGRFAEAGVEVPPWPSVARRLTELDEREDSYYLFAWRNPRPSVPIESLIVRSSGPRFVVAGLTIGHLDEHPLEAGPAVPVAISVTDPDIRDRPFDIHVDVDRGVAGFAYPLPAQRSATETEVAAAGWGEPLNKRSDRSYSFVSAVPSATVVISSGSDVIGAARWADIHRGAVEGERVRLEVGETGRSWIRTRVLDDATGRPIACRIAFRSPQGIPYQPQGHHPHVNSHLGSWNQDLGGDVRLGQTSYAYISGSCEGWLPRGDVIVEAAQGFEYEPLIQTVRIRPGQRDLELRLRRLRDMNAERWFSGDTHVHFLSTQAAHLEAAGEGVNVVNLLLAQWGHLFSNSEDFLGSPSVSADGRTIVHASQENRQHWLGHLSLLGLRSPVFPLSSDGPREATMGGALETTLSDWADRAHAVGGLVIAPHLPVPNGEIAALVATGRLDAVELVNHSSLATQEYYRYLNGGYRLPLVGGTDKMTAEVPVGIYRTYVHIPEEEPFTFGTWCANLAAGRTFMSGGPLLEFQVSGMGPGGTVRLTGSGGAIEVRARAVSIFPIHRVEILVGGKVVESSEDAGGAGELAVRATLHVTKPTWVIARVGGPGGQHVAHNDGWRRGVMAHTSPVYVTCGEDRHPYDEQVVRYMLALVDCAQEYVRSRSTDVPGRIMYHHGQVDHRSFLQRPFEEARKILVGRLATST